MSESAQKTIDVVANVFKSENAEIPLCISVVLASEGFELYSTKTCDPAEMEALTVLGLIAFEELKTSIASTTIGFFLYFLNFIPQPHLIIL